MVECRSNKAISMNSDDIKSIRIQDASISFIDQSQSMPLDIWLTNINGNINDFSMSQPFRLSLDASLYSNVPNVPLDLSKRSVQISDLKLHMDLSSWILISSKIFHLR